MEEKDKKRNISKSIKEKKWLSICYSNGQNNLKYFWIAIQDINPIERVINCDAFNITEINNSTKGIINVSLHYDKILEANVLNLSTYEQNEKLVDKILDNIGSFSWLNFDTYNDKILDYYTECVKYESVPYITEVALVKGIDVSVLENNNNNGEYLLSLNQIGELVLKLTKMAEEDKRRSPKIVKLVVNCLAISTKNGLYVICYKNLNFNPLKRALIIDSEVKFNFSFFQDSKSNQKYNLRNYLDYESNDFINLFLENEEKAKDLLNDQLKNEEKIDDRPYIFEDVRFNNERLFSDFNAIRIYKNERSLSLPLKAFFGNLDKSKSKVNNSVKVMLLDDKVNIDQLRAIYNSLKEPITYIQGPPGTGKTWTIVNTIISSFCNSNTVLVSSNNNKPINDIFSQLTSIEQDKYHSKILFPVLRLGNYSETIKGLATIREYLPIIEKYASDDKKLASIFDKNIEKNKKANELLLSREKMIEVEEELDAIRSFITKLPGLQSNFKAQELLEIKQKEYDNLPKITEEEVQNILFKADNSFLSWLFFTSIKYLKRLLLESNSELLSIIKLEDEEKAYSYFQTYLSEDGNMKKLLSIFPVILTTNQSASRLGNPEAHFDLSIIDEASQCSIAYSLSVILRGKRLLIVGDPNQLNPIIDIPDVVNASLKEKYDILDSYDYVNNSIMNTMQINDTISKFILLSYHYRSKKEIIDFCNKRYYSNRLKYKKNETKDNNALEFKDIDQQNEEYRKIKNVSMQELEAIIYDIKENNRTDCGIITPFRNQADAIIKALDIEKIKDCEVGTVHTFQGAEKDTIYFSPALNKHTSKKAFEWVSNNKELINVAVSRAKNKFLLFCDEKYILNNSITDDDISELLHYVKTNGISTPLSKYNNKKYINGDNYKLYSTETENEVIQTVDHVLSLNLKYKLEHHVKMNSILDRFTTPKSHNYGSKAEFDLVIFDNLSRPILIFEIDGEEHLNNKKVIKRDKLKEQICKDNNLRLIRIGNDYSRRYVFIKEILQDMLTT